MNRKLILCFAAVIVGQAMANSVFDGDELRKVSDQFGQSSLAIVNHLNELFGIPISATENQKTYEKVRSYVIKSQSELETEITKLKDLVNKHVDPKISEKINELEKEIKKQTTDAKALFEEKVGKPITDKYKDDLKKLTDSVIKTTKEVETTVTKAIDGVKTTK
ncbi:Hypothetical protein CINCED_3A022248 [Cinara cedri]|uniref:Uncharacterized protein n=1 Tax=Cinara cedri TaxID=506608 RepID=A0A5E4MIP7_9HEMI|nr:Hypothetical protein CINCED_3A022248 [Cinara cedri]